MVSCVCRTFYILNGKNLPEKIIVYRDGVGSGDIARLKETEIAALRVIVKRKHVFNCRFELVGIYRKLVLKPGRRQIILPTSPALLL